MHLSRRSKSNILIIMSGILGHTSSGHYLVALEQADGLWNLENKEDYGDIGDPYPGSTDNRNFNNSTIPDS